MITILFKKILICNNQDYYFKLNDILLILNSIILYNQKYFILANYYNKSVIINKGKVLRIILSIDECESHSH